MVWLVLVLSIAAVALLYWLIRRSAATGFASLFYLVPAVTALFAYILFGERLDSISIFGMLICSSGVALVNRGIAAPARLRTLGLNVPAAMQARVDETIK
jgi:drug/metabolite transporter (DMT)-like permease